MGLFDRVLNREPKPKPPFWRTPPFATSDAGVLHQHGISSVGRQDGRAMISTGWAIWRVAGIHSHQAFDFISDGIGFWRTSATYDVAQDRLLIRELFDGLQADPPVPADIWSAPPELVEPAAAHYSARCWAASELAGLGAEGDERRELYSAISRAPQPFVPPRSMSWARAYASNAGLPEPWA